MKTHLLRVMDRYTARRVEERGKMSCKNINPEQGKRSEIGHLVISERI